MYRALRLRKNYRTVYFTPHSPNSWNTNAGMQCIKATHAVVSFLSTVWMFRPSVSFSVPAMEINLLFFSAG
jgi:hypothetical protein